jgi:glycosyltransferase involved in cell wall biosynthesis
MSHHPRVSAVIIFWNAERFLAEAVESVFAQTFDEWELLLVDDGSTDASTAMAREYAHRNPDRVRYLEHAHHANHGRSASRNLGIRHAAGDYIAFLDADDVWLPDKLRLQVALLESQPTAAMLYGRTQRWYSWTGRAEDTLKDYTPPLGIPANTLVPPPTLLSLFIRRQAPAPCTCSVLVRRSAISRVGAFEDAFPGMYDDQVLYAKICLREPVYASGECLDRYRRHADSCRAVARRTGQYYPARLAYLTWLADYLRQSEVSDADLWNAVRSETWRARHPALAARADLLASLASRALPRWT